VEGGELEEGCFVGAEGGSVCCFPGDGNVGAVDDAFGVLGVYYCCGLNGWGGEGGRAGGEAAVRQVIEECARVALLCGWGEERARDEEDRRCLPFEYGFFEGAHAITVVMAKVERTEAVKNALVRENE